MSAVNGGNNLTSAFIDLASFDEFEKYSYGGGNAITYFVKQVRKSTWFSICPVALTKNGNPQFGSQFQVSISRAGDYMVRSWLRVVLPAVSANFVTNPSGIPASWASAAAAGQVGIRWTRNFMHNLVKEASITFNDLVESRFDTYFLDFWAAFTIPAGKRNGYQNMIGNFEELTNPRAINASITSLPSAVLNLPLPFPHFRETGIALPTAALPYNDMRINFCFRNWWELLIIDNYSLSVSQAMPANYQLTSGTPMLVADVWAEYALVSNVERAQMGRAARDILIEQVQTAPIQNIGSNLLNSGNLMQVHFAHNVKCLFFAMQNITNLSEGSNYTAASPVPEPTGVVFGPALASDPIATTSLLYENTNRLANMSSDYFSLIQPWYTAVSIPMETGYHMYSYTLDLVNTNPMGGTNYGKLASVSIAPTPSADALLSSSATGTLSAPGVLAPSGAPIAQSFQFIVQVVNQNIVRIAGGALGFPVL